MLALAFLFSLSNAHSSNECSAGKLDLSFLEDTEIVCSFNGYNTDSTKIRYTPCREQVQCSCNNCSYNGQSFTAVQSSSSDNCEFVVNSNDSSVLSYPYDGQDTVYTYKTSSSYYSSYDYYKNFGLSYKDANGRRLNVNFECGYNYPDTKEYYTKCYTNDKYTTLYVYTTEACYWNVYFKYLVFFAGFVFTLFMSSLITGCVIYKQRKDVRDKSLVRDINVDDNGLNAEFDKTFTKYEEADCIRKSQKCIYHCTRMRCLNICTLTFGVIVSIWWGFHVGMFQFFFIWCILPILNMYKKVYIPVASACGDLLNAFGRLCVCKIFSNFTFMKNDADKKKNDDIKDNGNIFNEVYDMDYTNAFPKSDETKYCANAERNCYNILRIGSYNVCSACVGLPCSCMCGAYYALFQLYLMWWVYPGTRFVKMCCMPCAKCLGLLLNKTYDHALNDDDKELVANIVNSNDVVELNVQDGNPTVTKGRTYAPI